jgi:site-specific DNA-methyltransferase (adenine-specific)
MSVESSWNRKQLFSTTGVEGSGEWETPDALFVAVNKEFGFDLDAAATAANTKLDDNYITPDENALVVDWSSRGKVVWLNPPYGRGMDQWLKKSYEESLKGCTIVVLTFVRSDTAWWQDWAMKAAEIRLIKGRVYFDQDGKTGPATAPSCLLVFSEQHRVPQFTNVTLPRRDE